jgi:hypothetical protein
MGHIPPPVITFVIYVADGTDEWTHPFPVDIDPSVLIVLVKPATAENFVTQEPGVDYDIQDPNTIKFRPGRIPLAGGLIRLERFTDRRRVLDYTGGSTLTADNLNLDNDQEFYILQEIESDLSNALRKNAGNTAWDGEGLPSVNAAPTTDPNGWVTLSQVEGIFFGTDITEVDGAVVYQFIGTGNTRDFHLFDTAVVRPEQLLVSLDGAIQHSFEETVYRIINPGDFEYNDFVYDGAVLRFVTPPIQGQVIEVRHFKGTVATVIQNETIIGDQIQDCAIKKQHICVPGSGTRRLVFNAAGIASEQDDASITPIQAALDTFLSTRKLSHFNNSAGMPFANETLYVSPGTGVGIEFTAGGGQIRNLIGPINPGDAANKGYVDAEVGAVSVQSPVERAERGTISTNRRVVDPPTTVLLDNPAWRAHKIHIVAQAVGDWTGIPGSPVLAEYWNTYVSFTVVFKGQDPDPIKLRAPDFPPAGIVSPDITRGPIISVKTRGITAGGGFEIQLIRGGLFPTGDTGLRDIRYYAERAQ